MPIPTAFPSSRTIILSAVRIDDVRCETMKTVGLYGRFLRAFLRAASVAKSSADALSSRISISGRLTSARAIVSLCF